MADKEESEKLNKKAIIVVALPVLLVGLFLVLFFTVFSDDSIDNDSETVSIESNVEITDAEELEIEGLAEAYIKEAGHFGVREDQLTSDNIDEMANLLETDPESASSYFTPRSIVYEGLDQFIYENSPLYYSPAVVESWSNDFETVSRASFSVESIQTEASDTGAYINVNGDNMRSASVNVSFNSKEKMFVEQGSEIGAERSYSVMEKDFDNTATFVFVYEEHEEESEDEDHAHGSHWKLYNIRGLENEFVLASWSDPNAEDFTDTQFNFVETGKIVPSDQNIQPALPSEEE